MGKRLTASERKSVSREIFEAMADVGFLAWQAQQPEDFRELREEHTMDELRREYAGHFEQVAWADIQQMARNASDEQLLDVRAEWIERSNASGIWQWMIDKDREAAKRPEPQPEQDIDFDR